MNSCLFFITAGWEKSHFEKEGGDSHRQVRERKKVKSSSKRALVP